jgi:aspartate/tyrosine/aromatic aminotransferase
MLHDPARTPRDAIMLAARLLADSVSFAKSFSPYGERVGLLFVVTENGTQADLEYAGGAGAKSR